MRHGLILFACFWVSISNVWAENGPASPCHQYYPNISGEVLLENDKVVVQRFVFPPGVWEGVHSHPPDQLYEPRRDSWRLIGLSQAAKADPCSC